jgi:hypothetical protein
MLHAVFIIFMYFQSYLLTADRFTKILNCRKPTVGYVIAFVLIKELCRYNLNLRTCFMRVYSKGLTRYSKLMFISTSSTRYGIWYNFQSLRFNYPGTKSTNHAINIKASLRISKQKALVLDETTFYHRVYLLQSIHL